MEAISLGQTEFGVPVTHPGRSAQRVGGCSSHGRGSWCHRGQVSLTVTDFSEGSPLKVSVAQSCLTLCDPMDCSPPGSSVHGILQARIPE